MRFVITTTPPAEAAPLLRQLVEERIVAGGNIMPGLHSFYWWQGSVADEQEALLFMETSEQDLDRRLARIAELHSYEVPKIVTLTPSEVLPAYLAWVQAQTRSD